MNQLWRKIKHKIYKVLRVNYTEAYLYNLLENLKKAKNQQLVLPFIIQSSNDKGFIVKMGGMYGFVDFRNMPWRYHKRDSWSGISKHLIGNRFYGEIYNISGTQKPFWINIDAKVHKFRTKALVPDQAYDTVIIQKSRYGLFVDAGFHNNWQYGSFFGLLHLKGLWDRNEYEQAQEGQLISTFFRGYTKEGKLIFGKPDFQIEWTTGELDAFVGTTKKVTVRLNENGKKEFFVNDVYFARFPVTIMYYPKSQISIAKSFKAELKDGDVFEGEILKIHNRKYFVGKIPIAETTISGNNKHI